MALATTFSDRIRVFPARRLPIASREPQDMGPVRSFLALQFERNLLKFASVADSFSFCVGIFNTYGPVEDGSPLRGYIGLPSRTAARAELETSSTDIADPSGADETGPHREITRVDTILSESMQNATNASSIVLDSEYDLRLEDQTTRLINTARDTETFVWLKKVLDPARDVKLRRASGIWMKVHGSSGTHSSLQKAIWDYVCEEDLLI